MDKNLTENEYRQNEVTIQTLLSSSATLAGINDAPHEQNPYHCSKPYTYWTETNNVQYFMKILLYVIWFI